MFWVIDRIIDNQVYLISDEDETRVCRRDELPEGINEGLVLRDNGGLLIPDEEETARRREAAKSRLSRLFTRSKHKEDTP